MSRRKLPYLPLYIQDFLTDEKLAECSPAATGVYIKLMCLMHKSEHYGKLLLKQKYKQTDKQISNFALAFAKHFAWSVLDVELAISELVEEEVLHIEENFLIQKRMVRDSEISDSRAFSGSKGGKNTQKKRSDFAKAKNKANTESEIIKESLTKNDSDFEKASEREKNEIVMVVIEMQKKWLEFKPGYSQMQAVDYPALLNLAYLIAERKGFKKSSVTNEKEGAVLVSWEKICRFLSTKEAGKYLQSLTLDGLSIPKNFQKLEEAMKNGIFHQEEKIEEMEKMRITPENYFEQ